MLPASSSPSACRQPSNILPFPSLLRRQNREEGFLPLHPPHLRSWLVVALLHCYGSGGRRSKGVERGTDGRTAGLFQPPSYASLISEARMNKRGKSRKGGKSLAGGEICRNFTFYTPQKRGLANPPLQFLPFTRERDGGIACTEACRFPALAGLCACMCGGGGGCKVAEDGAREDGASPLCVCVRGGKDPHIRCFPRSMRPWVPDPFRSLLDAHAIG